MCRGFLDLRTRCGHAQRRDHTRLRQSGAHQRHARQGTEDEIVAASATAKAPSPTRSSRARAAERVEREVDVILHEDDGTILEGIADLAFFERGKGWTVIDFKTDLAIGERKDAYARQIAIYARAIAAATGEEARGVLLSV
ncbi:MAG: PD-(D/E)XK nuclease family protein [Labilithrix sp.]|nr:PD-(D/E)XK nuclease family protein [Labilithrix sp.]